MALGLFFLFFGSYSADSITIDTLGPGFIYHSRVQTNPDMTIKILEVHVKNPLISLNGVCARDTLGVSLERTSSMAQRKNQSGNIVMGALNADFFSFESCKSINSMIISREYAQGIWSNRTVFAMTDNHQPVIGAISFYGWVTNPANQRYDLDGVNISRATDKIILYNSYQHLTTQTNTWGTEVRIKILDSLTIDHAIHCEVIEKESNIGNMAITAGSMILSGHGQGKVYLDSTLHVGDTVQLNLTTMPGVGSLYSLVGGGPRLLTDGKIPASFIGMESFDVSFTDSQHPRSAVGFTRDSSIVYLVAVDGRQPGLSDGMTLTELAKLMLSLGCYQATNLDGGGSTAMVIRDSIVNSPSDPTERSVANALIAVYQASSAELAHHLLIQPESMILDTSQHPYISCRVMDRHGYPLPVKTSEIQWQTSSISGTVDTQGYFNPIAAGQGYLIAHYQDIKDSIAISIENYPVPYWMRSATGIGTRGVPSWFSQEDHTERGLAFSSHNRQSRLYVVSRKTVPAIYILDAITGDSLGNLAMNGITTGTLPVNDVEASSDGILFAANMTRNAKSVPFKVYQWDDPAALPQMIISYADTNYTLGDRFTVVGSIEDNSAKLYAAAVNSNAVLIWSMQDGKFNPKPERILISGIKKLGGNVCVYPDPVKPDQIYINSDSIAIRNYNFQGILQDSLPQNRIGTTNNTFKIIHIQSSTYALVFEYGAGKETACMLDISQGLQNATLIHHFPSLGLNDNTVLSGDVDYSMLNATQIAVFILGSNNGLAAFPLNLDVSTSIDQPDQILPEKTFRLNQNYPNPFNAKTIISYQLYTQQHVRLNVFNLLGENIDELVNTLQPPGHYQVSWPEKKHASGLYFYSLEIVDSTMKPTHQVSKRMALLK